MWNQELLENAARAALGGRRLIVVTFRAPFIHEHLNGTVKCVVPAGGVTSALKPVLSALGGTWIAVGTGSADRITASPQGRLQVPPGRPSFTLRRVFLPESLRRRHYEGASNQMLWPLCHHTYCRPVYDPGNWNAYRTVNRIVADAVLEEADGRPAVVFVQDYQFALLPRMLQQSGERLTIGQFWHIPFPNHDVARTFPWADELVDGLLGNDVLGFHLPRYADNFCDAAVQLSPGCKRFGKSVWSGRHSSRIAVAPVGIDVAQHSRNADSAEVEASMNTWRERLGSSTRVGVGIDRLDYTKGIPERLGALSALFEAEPALRGKLTFVQVGVPSRGGIPDYADLDRNVDSAVRALNLRFGASDWTPVIFERRNLPPHEMMALHRLADFCMVTPLHDGMNLVAKEFVASRNDGDGVLILSRFAGAANELKSSVLVNPFCCADLVEGVRCALAMRNSERRSRMQEARTAVQESNVYAWAGSLMMELGRAASGSGGIRIKTSSDVAASVA